MNYSGNMPDWHQYNPSQSGINDVTSTAQNVNSGHLSFISSISPTQLTNLNLSSEGHEKHQADPNFNPRHYQPHLSTNISHGHNATDNTPLASMVQMQNCIGHYGPSNTRNPMVDNLNGSMDLRNTAMSSLNEELGYRNNQVPLNGPISHLNGPNVMNMNAPHGSIGPRNTNVNSHATSRTGPPSFVPCKGLCCNPDPNIGYQQWEKYCSYQNNTTYRENIRSSAYQTDTRRFGTDFNFRKDNYDGKEVLPPIVPNAPNGADHRRNFPDFKYRKDRLFSRSYPPSSGTLQTYPMQNYNYTGEYQKYPYNVKEYSKMNNMNIPNQGIVKHQEQGFMNQQKYNNKQVPYQNSAMMSSNLTSTNINPNMIPSAQNTYFNSQYPRNLPTETSHDCQETADNVSMVNRMQTSTMHTPHPRYQIYQQKIAMQKFSMENHLKELTRIPGYQSHPKYKEFILRYREILKLQQSITYQGQIQQSPCVTTSAVNTSVPPINLQFDQNGVLINSNYIPEAFPRIPQVLNPQPSTDNSDKQSKQENTSIPEMVSHNVQKPEQLVSQQHNTHTAALCTENLQKQDRYPVQKCLDQNQFEVQKAENRSFNLSTNASNTSIQQKISKEFADKPELDVRQFLANWDESEDEDGANSNMPDVVLSDSTPVVVVGYENVDLSAKTLENLDGSKQEGISSNVITFENQAKNGVVPAQDCLTISYSSTENVEITKNTCKEIAKESIVQPGSIIQCISNGPDEIPTIHIVDNLEISNILQVTSGQVTETLEGQGTIPFFHERTEVEPNAITLESDKFKETDNRTESTTELENLNKEKYIVESSSPPKMVENTSQTSQINDQEELSTLPASTKDNLDSTQDINLKKQNSFTSEESHNPDDISLPDLPTSECTPISTTLNTPIHSDSEESSERVEDLTISTNPIEVIQNSPMISFTQSPVRKEPYDNLNDESTIKNKSTNSLETQYQTENRFKDNEGNNILDHDTVLNTFEFSTNIGKSKPMIIAKNNKEHASPNGNTSTSTNNEKAFLLGVETESAEATGMCMTLTSGEYELKIVSTGMQNKPMQDYKNSTTECRINESQAVVNQDVQTANKILQVISETGVKPPQYNSSMELNKTLQNIRNNPDSIECDEGKDINCAEMYETQLLKISNEGKSCAILSTNERKCTSTELTQIITTSENTINSSSTNNISSRNFKPAIEDNCSTKIVKNNPSTSHSTKNSTLNNDKLRKSETLVSNKSEKTNINSNKSIKIDIKNLKNSRHVKLIDNKKSTLDDQTHSHNKKCCSESTTEKYNETDAHHNTQEIGMHKIKSCAIEDVKESNILQNESKVIDSDVDNSRERMRFLKEYRRMKYKSSDTGETQNKDTQEVSEYNKNHISSNLDERSMSQVLNDKQVCQKNTKLKLSEEQERKHAILKTFVSKSINPDFAIQVTNVNLKLKDNDHQKQLQLREEAKNSGSLDAIKIEINVSCSERNTTEKLFHENIKNAVAETIGHLTNSISNGARSNTNLTEIQCDKTNCDKADFRDYERRNKSPIVLTEVCTYNEIRKDQNSADKSDITVSKEDMTNNEISTSFISKKKRNSSSEQELTNNIYEDKGDVNIESQPTPNTLEISKSELIRRKNLHQDAERKIVANTEESRISSNNSPSMESTSKSVNIQKKEHQEMTFLCRNTRNSQDNLGSKLTAGPSTSSNTTDSGLENTNYHNFTRFDYNHFDVAPNENEDADDKYTDRWKKSKKIDDRFNDFDLYGSASGYMNPIFFVNELEDLNTVPVYTTKDGKITYSPNPRFTYRELIMEARAKESYDNTREQYFERSTSFDYYNCSKLRKVLKRNREVTIASRKREIDFVDAKSQFTTRHIDYLQNKNTAHKNSYCAKTRSTVHLEFFNDEADKLYTNRSMQQESKENNKKTIVNSNFSEKRGNPNGESASDVKNHKTKITDCIDYEKEYNESSVFESNLFLGLRAPCWEETMESVKSYSSHIDRRNNDNRKELNFSQIFAAQKKLNTFQFKSVEQNSSNDNSNYKTSNNTTNEILPCSSYIDDLHLIRDGDSQCEQSKIAPRNEQKNKNENKNDASATHVNDKSASMHNVSYDDYAKKQQTQSDGIEPNAIIFTEKPQSYSPKTINVKAHILGKDQYYTSYTKDGETLVGHPVRDDMHENKCDGEDVSLKQNENSIKVASPSKSSADLKNLSDEPKCTETKESVLALNEQTDGISESTKNISNFMVDDIVYQQVSSVPVNCKDKEAVLPVVEPNISTETCFNQTNKQNSMYNKENSATYKEKESIVSQNPYDVASASQSLDEENNDKTLRKLENGEQSTKNLLEKQENDEVDNNNTTIKSKPANTLDLHPIQTEEKVCNLFTNDKCEQNISEFTVIKSIIKADKKLYQETEMKENPHDCDNIIDTKLLCMDSSCGIYAEDQCALTQISEHDFTEDDSMVPMEWETSQIQEDAVNHLCNINDQSSIDFAGAANSLHNEDNSLLDNLSLSKSIVKVPQVLETTTENKSNEPVTITESTPAIDKSKIIPCNENMQDKEQSQDSSSSYKKIAYLRATDCNANTKMVPKLVIKKTEVSSKFITKVSSSSVADNIVKSIIKPSCQPKIPKMIIRNVRSRPSTPSIEAVSEEMSAQINISDRILLTMHNEMKEELYENDSESTLQGSNSHKNKIPKMKIKLDEKYSNKIVTDENISEVCVKRKNIKKTIPKVKIKTLSRADSDNSTCSSTFSPELKDLGKYEEKIPILKLKKQERNRSSSPEAMRKRQSSNHAEVPIKKCKKEGRDNVEHLMKYNNSDSAHTILSEYETKKNPLVCISEKIPKVIIKRTSASAEFKCEFSKGCKNVIAKSAKWQPEVKLERYRILDSMVKDLKSSSCTPISLRIIDKIFANRKNNDRQEGKEDDYNLHRLSRSNSTSNLLPTKCKQRRMSDYDCKRIGALSYTPLQDSTNIDKDSDSKNTKMCTTSSKNVSSRNHSKSADDYQEDNKCRSTSRDNSRQRTEVDVMSEETAQSTLRKSDKIVSQYDECKTDCFDINHDQTIKTDKDASISIKDQKNVSIQHSNSTNFKTTSKDLKSTSKIENCFVKLPSLSGITSEKIDPQINEKQNKEQEDFLIDESKIVIKKECLSCSNLDNECTLQDDISSFKDDSVCILDNFEMDNDSVIKIDSSDESQTTIEILPASPNNSDLESHIIEDGDSEQLYPADAIPTQFELELEITDNSNIDLLDVPMPKLDPAVCFNSRRVSTEEYCNDQTSKVKRYNESEFLSRGKNLLIKGKQVEINDDNRSMLENKSGCSPEEISSKFPCSKRTGSTATMASFCCNESLIKEVLAAKETLKKCFSRCESSAKNNPRPKTAAEKKQGSSFDLNVSDTHSKSNDASQSYRSGISPQKSSVPTASKYNKTENTSNAEKSDKKHSKQSKNICIKKRLKSPEKKNEDFCSTFSFADSKETHECPTISLKTFRRFGQAASKESLNCSTNLNDKKKKIDIVPQLCDSQQKEDNKMSYKIPKISKSIDHKNNVISNSNEIKSKEDNMPILEPEIAVNFDASSDRDSSRSPPIITIQDSGDIDVSESKLVDDKVITSDDKIESDIKDIHKKNEMSIADFVTQLAYHEKATIKHRRYCNLCERWFPTTSRHRRHLAGYQHRHIELTQRRSIHALFMLFTGKPCPRLLPANVVRSDCSVGELTPLQIAVQDVTKCFDHTQSPKKQNNVDK